MIFGLLKKYLFLIRVFASYQKVAKLEMSIFVSRYYVVIFMQILNLYYTVCPRKDVTDKMRRKITFD